MYNNAKSNNAELAGLWNSLEHCAIYLFIFFLFSFLVECRNRTLGYFMGNCMHCELMLSISPQSRPP
uniref:Uncharacterized protein n=1 Tax=Anguilla anguilla TaxID=7936 RepID=A0A0E9PWF3_ANGAN